MTQMPFDIFVLPFTLGMSLLLAYLLLKYAHWVWLLPTSDKLRILKGFFSLKSLRACGEIFMESLLHRKIFRVDKRLGFMHMSLAFGWFLLIVIGAIEAHTYAGGSAPFYFPIFFRFFVPYEAHFFLSSVYVQLMDAALLLVLTGVGMAFAKRFKSNIVGMKKTTKLRRRDKAVLYSLWLIFPMRLLAESTTSGLHNSGGFLTGSLGNIMSYFLPLQYMEYPLWWGYSIVLCIFFLGLPTSRYMHIPTEMVLIFFRNWGIKLHPDNPILEEVMILSCPRCGICIDRCQLNTNLNINDTQAVYFLQRIRRGEDYSAQANNCLMCGRCESVCPVGIDLNAIRNRRRLNFTPKEVVLPYDNKQQRQAKVVYFAGCMGHLTPHTKNAMVKILQASGDDFWFMDEDGGVCCGRPMKLAGQVDAARQLMDKNRATILQSGATTLVTSCPICYKVFKEEYGLNINILHHTEYIEQLLKSGKLKVTRQDMMAVYHDPCELGRGSGIYEQPRNVLSAVTNLEASSNERRDSLCCGGSLANLTLPSAKKHELARQTMQVLTANNPDLVATACPLCKRTLQRAGETLVMDIAEVVVRAMDCK